MVVFDVQRYYSKCLLTFTDKEYTDMHCVYGFCNENGTHTQGHINPRGLVTQPTKLHRMMSNMSSVITATSSSLHTKMCVSLHAPSRKCHIRVTFTGNSKIVGSQHVTCFTSPFWHLKFGSHSWISGKFVDPCPSN